MRGVKLSAVRNAIESGHSDAASSPQARRGIKPITKETQEKT